MRTSLFISFSMHFAVVAAAFITLPEVQKLEVKKTESIPVEILTLSEFSKLTAKADDEKAEEKPEPEPEKKTEPKPEPEKKEVKVAPPQPPKPPEPKVEIPPLPKPPEPKAEVTPPTPKPPEPKAEKPPEPEKKTAEAKRPLKSVPIPRVRPKLAQIKPKKESTFDSQKIAALLNKLPDDKPVAASKPAGEKKKPSPAKTKSRFDGRDEIVSASEKDLLRQRISGCWNTPVGVTDAEKLIVKVRIFLKRDGTLMRPPEIMNSASGIAADSAIRAIRRCGPYDMLPQKKYNVWREVVLNFDPREMFGG